MRFLRDTIDIHQHLVRINNVKGLLLNISNSFIHFNRNYSKVIPEHTLLGPLLLSTTLHGCVDIACVLLLVSLPSQIDFSGWLLEVLYLASAHRFALFDLFGFPYLPNLIILNRQTVTAFHSLRFLRFLLIYLRGIKLQELLLFNLRFLQELGDLKQTLGVLVELRVLPGIWVPHRMQVLLGL